MANSHELRLNHTQTHPHDSEPPPDGGYGWINVGVCFSISCFTWGVVTSYSVYLAYYLAHDLYPGSSSLDYAIIGGLNFSIATLVAPIVTIITRIYGPRLPMLMGVVFQTSGYCGASFAYRLWHVYFCQGALIGLGVGFIYIPSIAILSQWFTAKRSLANGISAAGSGIGGLVFSFAVGAMIHNISVSWSLRITGMITGVVNLAAALLIRHRNEIVQPPQRGFDVHLLRRLDVILLLAWAFLSTLGQITLLFSLPDFARSIDLSVSQGAALSAFVSLGTAIGRPCIGVLSDRFGKIETAGTLTLLCSFTVLAIWLPATSYGVTILFAIFGGAVLGVFWVVSRLAASFDVNLVDGKLDDRAPGCRDWRTRRASVSAFPGVVIRHSSCLSEVIALKLRRPGSQREYLYPQIFAGLSYLVASFCLFLLRQVRRM
ncbi:MAG: hypothetical protein Q9211_002506 [Gyalolechia sp. 1 TL-2023]